MGVQAVEELLGIDLLPGRVLEVRRKLWHTAVAGNKVVRTVRWRGR